MSFFTSIFLFCAVGREGATGAGAFAFLGDKFVDGPNDSQQDNYRNCSILNG